MAEYGLESMEGYFPPDFREYVVREQLKWRRLDIFHKPDAHSCPYEDDIVWKGNKWVFWSRRDDHPDRLLCHDISGKPDGYVYPCPQIPDLEWEGIEWPLWNCQDDYLDSPLYYDNFVGSIPDACLDIRANIRKALHKMVSCPCLNYSLIQFWAPTKTSEGRTLLKTQCQPFALGKTSISYKGNTRTLLKTQCQPFALGKTSISYEGNTERLCEYRMKICREYNCFYADAESGEEQLGLPGRVFLREHSEFQDVQFYSLNEYPQRDLALSCSIKASWGLPVVERSSQTCVGVLEISSLYDLPLTRYSHLFDMFQDGGGTLQLGQLGQPSLNAVNSRVNVVNEAQNYNLPSFEPLQKGKVAMQLDSSDQPSMDPSNNGQNVTTAKQNIIVGASAEEGKGKKQEREGSKSGVKIEVSLEEIIMCSKMSRDNAARKLEVSISTFKRVCRGHGIRRWPPRDIKMVHSSRPLPFENQEQALPLNFGLPLNQASTGVVHIKPPFQDVDLVTIRAKYENIMIKFRLSLSSRFIDLQQEVAKRLNLEAGSYHVKYKDEEDYMILIACDDDLQDCVRLYRSVGNTSIMVQLEPKQTS